MLRVIIDGHGSGSNDLFVKIDGSPSRAWIVDSWWLGYFFSVGNDFFENKEYSQLEGNEDVALLIQLWQKMLGSDQPVCYLPYDLSDQYIGAFQVTKRKKLHHLTRVSTQEITGNTTETYFLESQHSVNWQQSTDPVLAWDLAPSSIQVGLAWSLTQLKQPVVPLRYD